jgi:homoserine dehydrogenase
VYETVKRYPRVFEIRHVVVRDPKRYPDVDHLTTDPSFVLDEAVDVVVVCIPGTGLAYPLIAAALSAGKFVITPNKAAVAAHAMSLATYTRVATAGCGIPQPSAAHCPHWKRWLR